MISTLIKTRSKLYIPLLLFSIGLIASISGCSLTKLARYDENTYRYLTFLKADVNILYDSFVESVIDKEDIRDIKLRLAQVREYEAGKGMEENKDMVEQIESLQTMYGDHVKDRLESKKAWSEEHMNNKKESINDAFDTAIRTERAKNK